MSAAGIDAPFRTSFKAAWAGADTEWTIDGTKLSKGGRVVADLASVTEGYWHDTTAKGVQLRTLKLKSATGTATVAVNGSAGQRSFTNFYKLALAALAVTAMHSPNARINMGGGLANMIMMFVLGTALFALGVFCTVMAIIQSTRFVALVGVPFLGISGLLMYTMRPWGHHRLSVPPAIALQQIMQG